MPGLDRGRCFQLALLLLIVPAQYFLTQWKPTTSSQRSVEIERLLTGLHTWHGKFTNPNWWKQRGQNAWNTMSDFLNHFEKYGEKIVYGDSRKDDLDDDPDGESPAYEVLKFRESNGFFGGSTEKRSPRPRHVKFRIGQVVRHKRLGYRGVIVGWDLTAKAPAQWLSDNIPRDQIHTLKFPFYALAIDVRDMHVPVPIVVYHSEEDLEVMTIPTMVQHPQVDEYFTAYDGSRFLARSWLKKIYPHDQ
ncbi:uncharacterized protein LOC115918968 [Strongylocentrotus purpuratus]|uniref:Hemimethylated DNA-binding domain-containing protein n=1 Tax=Strongylocentrotus purpuratus TaxID=7668 RepID=A0A7M7PMX0_STRPU|nr:uncharacterized protein LOC100888448 isoform X1 [Strongylocentrotus purpuratus]XP_030851790.1 uncharacterized protein LOC115918968 [Strongylocentrotus purpuratus]|eukprot:XP_003729107.1 PREDICTED: uncharacterized protein LOC100888448 isoform X1 [Strongylocentrotus purpuratus]